MASVVNFEQWVYEVVGKKIDFDKAYGVQCVDLFNHYVTYCLNRKVGYYPQLAKDFYNNFYKIKWMKDNFRLVKLEDMERKDYKKGIIGVRNHRGAGHIFIVESLSVNGLNIIDQNHTGKNDPATRHTIPLTKDYVTGFLIPKNVTFYTPRYDVGSKYKLTAFVNVWNAPRCTERTLRSTATDYAKQHSNDDKYLVLKDNTIFEALAIATDKFNNIWVKTYSGWISVYYKGEKRANWVKEN